VRIDLFIHTPEEDTTSRKLDTILEMLTAQKGKEDIVMADLSQLTAQVEANTTVVESAITLIGGLKSALDAAGTDPVALKALSDSLAAEDTKLAAAIQANTPAAPPAPAPPPAEPPPAAPV
jgi:hypothetical protein